MGLAASAVLSGSLSSGSAATIRLPCVADTTLSENYPSNNLGAVTHVSSGTTQNATRSRGLFRFDVAGAIPAGSRIRSAALVLEVIGVPALPSPFSDFSVHRVLRPWGEGQKTSPTNCTSCAGQGALATTNEATWLYRFAFTTNTWSAPGAAATNDYFPAASLSQTIYGTADSPYTFASTARMVADVQLWLDRPASNFGSILVCQSEAQTLTARRFGSRENPDFAPRLEIDYLAPPLIKSVSSVSNQLVLRFTAEANQAYVVEFRKSVPAGPWQVLTHFPAQPLPRDVVLVDPISEDRRFYRLGTP